MSLTDFTRSAQTAALVEGLRVAPIGTVMTYRALSTLIGEDILGCRHYLYSAIKALYEEGVPFGTVRGEGVKRLSVEEIPDIGDHAIGRIRRASRRARKRMGVVSQMNDVPLNVRIQVNGSSALLNLVEHFAQNKSRKAIETHVAKSDGALPPMKLLDALRG